MAREGRVIYKRTGGRKRKTGSRAAADEDEDEDEDEEYVIGEEDDEESESLEESYASSRDASEEEFEFGESNSGSDEEEEEMEEEEDEEKAEIELPRSKPRRGASNGWRTVKKPRVLDDEEEEVSVPRKRARGGSRQKKSRVWDDEEEEEEDDDDEDFSPDEDEDEEEEVSLISGTKSGCGRKGDSKRCRKKRKLGVSKQKRKKRTARAPSRKRRRRARISDEDDDDFIVKDRIAVDKKRKKSKKRTKKKTTTSRAARKISPADSESSDFDYVTSDDDFVEKDRIPLDNQRKKNKEGKKKTTAPRTPRSGRKRPSSVGSDSESSDYDYVISEEELRDLGVGGVLSEPQPKRISAGRKSEEKGKEKEADESGKQICGICLSEEQKGTIQGVLNCCAHYFCLPCIMEWSKVESRCPVCKRRFMTITRSATSDWGVGLRKAVIKVQKRDQVYQPSEEEMRVWLDPYENVVCMECQQGEDDNLMLLCDICDSSAHTYCVGLGKEVPEGNWYCELCRSAGEGSSYSQVQDAPTNQGASRRDLFSGGRETEEVSRNMSASMNSQRSVPLTGQSSQGIDLNVSPRHFAEEDNGAASHASGGGASTLSGRRAIQRRIRILLSNSRPRQVFARVNIPWRNVESDAIISGIEQGGEASRVTVAVNSLHSVSSIEQQQNIRTFQSSANLAPSMYSEGNSFRHVEGAKEEVQSMVKSHLTNLCRNFPLEHATFKEIARRSTHTILAACGIEHRRRMVAAAVQPPNNCPHVLYDDESAYLMKGCCSSCFSSFVKGVVQKLMHTTSSQS